MANQNVGTPRFYIDKTSYLNTAGIAKADDGQDCFGLNTSSLYSYTIGAPIESFVFRSNVNMPVSYNFLAILGHKLTTSEVGYDYFDLKWDDDNADGIGTPFIQNAETDESQRDGMDLWEGLEGEHAYTKAACQRCLAC